LSSWGETIGGPLEGCHIWDLTQNFAGAQILDEACVSLVAGGVGCVGQLRVAGRDFALGYHKIGHTQGKLVLVEQHLLNPAIHFLPSAVYWKCTALPGAHVVVPLFNLFRVAMLLVIKPPAHRRKHFPLQFFDRLESPLGVLVFGLEVGLNFALVAVLQPRIWIAAFADTRHRWYLCALQPPKKRPVRCACVRRPACQPDLPTEDCPRTLPRQGDR